MEGIMPFKKKTFKGFWNFAYRKKSKTFGEEKKREKRMPIWIGEKKCICI